MDFDPFILEQVRKDWQAAPYGGKKSIIDGWAVRIGCTYQTLYREMPTKRQRRKGERRIAGIEEYATIVAQIKKRPPEHLGELTTAQALKIALDNGVVPKEMAKVPASTFDRVLREIGMTKRQRRISRYQAERPNQLHHVDASSSKCFYIARQLPDGDYVLKLHAGVSGYKNKPVPIRLRPWVYGLTDDHSGYHLARYVAAYGESAKDNLDFLAWAWSKNDDKVLFGLPDQVKGDCGPMMKSEAAPEWFDRLGVKIDPSVPLQKDAHGKIERPWRTLWQCFEKPFFAESEWKKYEITLSDLNRRFLNYLEEYNAKPHRFEKNISRLQAWQRISLYGGAVAMPEDAILTAVRRWSRKVDAAGCFSIDNILYEVKGLHDAWAYIYRGIFDDRMVVVDQTTGQKYEVEDFVPNPVGTFKAHPETPHQKAVKAAETLELTNTLYSEPADKGNVAMFPTRIKETRQMDNPLTVDAYPSVEAAMHEFTALCGLKLDKENRAAIRQLLLENGLSRRVVTDLALEFQVENERRKIHG